MSNEKIYEISVSKFYGDKDDDLDLWSIRVKAALRDKELISILTKEFLESNLNEQEWPLL